MQLFVLEAFGTTQAFRGLKGESLKDLFKELVKNYDHVIGAAASAIGRSRQTTDIVIRTKVVQAFARWAVRNMILIEVSKGRGLVDGGGGGGGGDGKGKEFMCILHARVAKRTCKSN